MTVMLRDALPDDAEALARLTTDASLGQWTCTPEEIRRRIKTVERSFTLSAVQGEAVVAGLSADPFPTAPGGLRLQFSGDAPAFTPLYLEALTRADRLGYQRLLSVVRQDHRPQVEFLGAASWRNAYQSWGAHLELGGFDFELYRALEEKHYLEGIEVHCYATDNPDAPWEALHALHDQGVRDTPRNPTTTLVPGDLAHFQREVARGPVFAALRRSQGPNCKVLSYTTLSLNGTTVDSEHTVTLASHRGRGLATLVKAFALEWARQQGYTRASAGGNIANLPMLRVNQSLGYLPEPMWLTWVRELPTPTSPA